MYTSPGATYGSFRTQSDALEGNGCVSPARRSNRLKQDRGEVDEKVW